MIWNKTWFTIDFVKWRTWKYFNTIETKIKNCYACCLQLTDVRCIKRTIRVVIIFRMFSSFKVVQWVIVCRVVLIVTDSFRTACRLYIFHPEFHYLHIYYITPCPPRDWTVPTISTDTNIKYYALSMSCHELYSRYKHQTTLGCTIIFSVIKAKIKKNVWYSKCT